jgi:hypothetical protein
MLDGLLPENCLKKRRLYIVLSVQCTVSPSTFDRDPFRSNFFTMHISTDPKLNKAKEKAPVDCTV